MSKSAAASGKSLAGAILLPFMPRPEPRIRPSGRAEVYLPVRVEGLSAPRQASGRTWHPKRGLRHSVGGVRLAPGEATNRPYGLRANLAFVVMRANPCPRALSLSNVVSWG
jgi:hypothetical protein